MDPQWKDENQAPGQQIQPGQSISPTPAPTPTPVPPAPAVPPTPSPAPDPAPEQPITPAAFAAQNAYDAYDPNAKPPSSARKIIVPILVLALVALPAGGYFLYASNKKSGGTQASQTPSDQAQPQANEAEQANIENKQPAVPVDWKTVDSKMGFSLKIPAGWSIGLSSDFNLNGLKAKATTISDPKADTGTFISVGTQSIDSAKTQQAFEDYMTSGKAFTDLGISKEQVNLTSKKVNINGKQWLQIDENETSSITKSLFLWVGDHAIVVSATGNKQAAVDELAEKYLLPMAASVEVK